MLQSGVVKNMVLAALQHAGIVGASGELGNTKMLQNQAVAFKPEAKKAKLEVEARAGPSAAVVPSYIPQVCAMYDMRT